MESSTRRTETVTTHELRTGDLVLTHGMQVRLGERREYDSSAEFQARYPRAGVTVAFAGTVENMDEVLAARIVPASFVQGGAWTIQGNGLAHWVREVAR